MSLEESKMFRDWFVILFENNGKMLFPPYTKNEMIGYDEGIIIDRNTDNEYIIKDLDCYETFYNEVMIQYNRNKKIEALGL